MSPQWIALIGSSIGVYGLKYLGSAIPQSVLAHPRIQKINGYIPIALLGALVAVQSITEKTKYVIDQRSTGIAFAIMALKAKAPFPVVVLGSALISAVVYRLHH